MSSITVPDAGKVPKLKIPAAGAPLTLPSTLVSNVASGITLVTKEVPLDHLMVNAESSIMALMTGLTAGMVPIGSPVNVTGRKKTVTVGPSTLVAIGATLVPPLHHRLTSTLCTPPGPGLVSPAIPSALHTIDSHDGDT